MCGTKFLLWLQFLAGVRRSFHLHVQTAIQAHNLLLSTRRKNRSAIPLCQGDHLFLNKNIMLLFLLILIYLFLCKQGNPAVNNER